MGIKTKQIVSVLLAIASSIGVGATAYLAVKQHKKAESRKNELLENKPDASKLDIIKAELPAYAPAIAIGGATVASIMASHILNKRAEASLIASATLLDQGWKRYKNKVKQLFGFETHEKIVTSIVEDESKKVKVDIDDGRKLYYVYPIGFFKAKPEDLAWAYGDMNQRLHTVDPSGQTANFCLLYDMLRDANAEILDENISNDKINWGWTAAYLDELCKPEWVHMRLSNKTLEDGTPYIYIDFDEKPIYDPSIGGSVYVDAVGSEDDVPKTFKKVEKPEDIKDVKHDKND